MYFLKTGEQTLEQTWEQTCEQTWEQSTDLGNRLGVFFKNFVKDNVVTKIHIFKNKPLHVIRPPFRWRPLDFTVMAVFYFPFCHLPL